MKKLALVFVLLFSSFAFAEEPCWECDTTLAWGVMSMWGGVESSGDPCGCPTATYRSCWTGDYDGDTDKICYNSGVGSEDGVNTNGTFHTDYGEDSSIGWLFDDSGDSLVWSNTGGIIFDHDNAAGQTIWTRIYASTDTPADTTLFEGDIDANNRFYCYVNNSPDGQIYCAYKGSSESTNAITSTDTLTRDAWNTIGYAVFPGEAGNDHAIIIIQANGTSTTGWQLENDGLSAMTGDPSVYIGNLTDTKTGDDDFYHNTFLVLDGFASGTDCPWEDNY